MIPASIIQKPRNGIEIVKKRTENSKTFDMGKGKKKLIHLFGAIHYKHKYSDRNELWKEIDLTIEEKKNLFVVENAPYNLEIFKDSIGLSYTSRRGGNIIFRLKKIGGTDVKDLSLNISPRINKNRLYWDNVVEDLDIYIDLRPLSCEFYKVLKSANAPKDWEWECVEDKVVFFKVNSKQITGEDKENRIVKVISTKSKVNLEKYKDKKYYLLHEKFEEKTVKIKDKRTRIKEWIDKVEYPVLIDADITELIVANNDDGYGTGYNHGWDWNNTEIKGGYRSTDYTMFPGLRFQGLAIAKEAEITNALLKVQLKNIFWADPTFRVYGDDVDDAGVFSNGDLPQNITKTDAFASWVPAAPYEWKTIDVKTIIQELVNRALWASGNDIRLAMFHQEAPISEQATFYDYAKSQADAAYLEIDFVAATTPKSVSDSGQGADAVSIKVKVGISDVGSGVDSPTLSAKIPITDLGSGVEILAIKNLLSVLDSGLGSEIIQKADQILAQDSGIGSEIINVKLVKAIQDSGIGTDIISAIKARLLITDLGSGVGAVSILSKVLIQDSGLGSEILSIKLVKAISDSGLGTEILEILGKIAISDTGQGADAIAVLVQMAVSDVGVGSDAIQALISLAVQDAGTGQEILGILAKISISDSALGEDVLKIAAAIAVSDSGAATDAVSWIRVFSVSDAGIGTDIIKKILAQILIADTGIGTDRVKVPSYFIDKYQKQENIYTNKHSKRKTKYQDKHFY